MIHYGRQREIFINNHSQQGDVEVLLMDGNCMLFENPKVPNAHRKNMQYPCHCTRKILKNSQAKYFLVFEIQC